MKSLIHTLTRSHSWRPMGHFSEEWIEGFRFWVELHICVGCDSAKWDQTRRAIEFGLVHA